MYTKGELEAMDIPQLVGIADELGIKVTPDDQMEDVIYAILDKAAENSATDDAAPKRKRTRITKKDTSKVYTVKGEDGENLDSKTNRRKKVETPSLFSDMPAEAPVKEEKPKRRGRRTKAEIEG
jgi:transcription termination factor Rho